MLAISRSAIAATERATDWSLEGHIERVYDVLRFHGDTPPKIEPREGESRPASQQSLMDWNADLGARHKMDWAGFLARHQAILKSLAGLPRLGLLSDGQIDIVLSVVLELEAFKRTSSRKLVFGSKSAHFHFPWLVPVMSSEVETALRALAAGHATDLQQLGLPPRPFTFSSPERRLASYRNYLVLGNEVMRNADSRQLLGARSPDYDLHAKLFEWWVISNAWDG